MCEVRADVTGGVGGYNLARKSRGLTAASMVNPQAADVQVSVATVARGRGADGCAAASTAAAAAENPSCVLLAAPCFVWPRAAEGRPAGAAPRPTSKLLWYSRVRSASHRSCVEQLRCDLGRGMQGAAARGYRERHAGSYRENKPFRPRAPMSHCSRVSR